MSSFTPTTTPGSQPPTEERNPQAQRRLFTSRQPLATSPTLEEVSITTNALLQDLHALTATVAELSTTLASLGSAFQRSAAQTDEIYGNCATKEELDDVNQLNETVIYDLIKDQAHHGRQHQRLQHALATTPDVGPLLKQLKTAYYALTDIHERQQQRDLQLNFLTTGGDIVFKRFGDALARVLTATRPGHAPALLNLQRRLKDEAYDGISNGFLAQLLLGATCGNTQIVLSQIVQDSPQAQVDGRLLLLRVHFRLITYPPSLDNSFLTKAKALRISESEDPAVKLNTFTTLIGNHRQLHPAFTGQQEQEVLIEILRASQESAEHLFSIPLYFEGIRAYDDSTSRTA
ncbi:hypothetical protein CYMTET_26670 [Cymbomonas tetramitiformis]|uniref:Uncharacterized protein n=1 Tax=Cymbomonas tetramitiformis TaxID=36881 RepID=A0AAE0FRU4_9CHLO|nr:hypothetical protein CYMTET_26670 [Cymbomonas tetramitiformis]